MDSSRSAKLELLKERVSYLGPMLSITGDVSCLVSEEAILRELTDALKMPPIFECVPPTEHSEGGLLFNHPNGTTFVTDITVDAWLPINAQKCPNEWRRFKYESALQSEGLDSAVSGKDGFLRFANRQKEQAERVAQQFMREIKSAFEKAIDKLFDDNSEADDAQCAADTTLESPSAVDPPKKYCCGWPEILDAVGLNNTSEHKSRVIQLNKSPKHPGPIPRCGQGKKPKVNAQKLVEWWNSLEDLFYELHSAELDKAESVANRHPYGRNAEVVPEINGSVKKRRSTQVRSVTEHHQTSQNIE